MISIAKMSSIRFNISTNILTKVDSQNLLHKRIMNGNLILSEQLQKREYANA